jgi:hypothetical protein
LRGGTTNKKANAFGGPYRNPIAKEKSNSSGWPSRVTPTKGECFMRSPLGGTHKPLRKEKIKKKKIMF